MTLARPRIVLICVSNNKSSLNVKDAQHINLGKCNKVCIEKWAQSICTILVLGLLVVNHVLYFVVMCIINKTGV